MQVCQDSYSSNDIHRAVLTLPEGKSFEVSLSSASKSHAIVLCSKSSIPRLFRAHERRVKNTFISNRVHGAQIEFIDRVVRGKASRAILAIYWRGMIDCGRQELEQNCSCLLQHLKSLGRGLHGVVWLSESRCIGRMSVLFRQL